ncbi:hypothetical protein Tco_0337745 [Tanacetum coccineum]
MVLREWKKLLHLSRSDMRCSMFRTISVHAYELLQEARIVADKAYDVSKVDDRLNRAVECQQSCQCR